MKKEQELQKDIRRAEQAKMILNNPLIVEYFETKRKTITDNLTTCKHWQNTQERDALLNMLQCFHDFEKDFKRHIQHGNKARTLLDKVLNR